MAQTKEPQSIKLNRRSFLKAGVLSTLAAGAAVSIPHSQARSIQLSKRKGHAHNVIVLVSDGMSMGTLCLADQFVLWRDRRHTHWMQAYLDRRGSRGVMDMASLNNLVTDSAAASSSWGGGHRVNNGALNISPEGRPHETVFELAKKVGKATGVVTTATVTHATPAGFGANVPQRNDEETIARQYFDRGYDVILGGGMRFFSSARRADALDLIAGYEQSGYAMAQDRASLLAFPDTYDRLLGLFADSFLPYEVDRMHQPELQANVPSLAEMSRSALRTLSRHSNGFILQIEGARVDHAAHANDAAGLIFDQLAFDDAIGVVFEFLKENPDTLVIVTSDHGNANPGLNNGPNGGDRTFSRLSQIRASFDGIPFSRETGVGDLREILHARTALDFSNEQVEILFAHMQGNHSMPYRRMNGRNSVLGQIMANHLEIGWIGNSHTADYTEILAVGPGSEILPPFLKNTELFQLMATALDLPVPLTSAGT